MQGPGCPGQRRPRPQKSKPTQKHSHNLALCPDSASCQAGHPHPTASSSSRCAVATEAGAATGEADSPSLPCPCVCVCLSAHAGQLLRPRAGARAWASRPPPRQGTPTPPPVLPGPPLDAFPAWAAAMRSGTGWPAVQLPTPTSLGSLSSLLLLSLLLWTVPVAGGSWQCPRILYSSSGDFDVEYEIPHISVGAPVQAVATYAGDEDASVVFVATRNRLHMLGPHLQPLQSLVTGPSGDPGCETCSACGPELRGPPGDTDMQVLLIDETLPALVSCGTSMHGRCFLHEMEDNGTILQLLPPACLFTAAHNRPESCPDCVASPLGTQAVLVDVSHASYLYVASTLDAQVAASFSPRSVSIRRLKADASGFQPVFEGLSVLPAFVASYPIEYIYSFQSGDFVYFLTLQPVHLNSASEARHTQVARLSAQPFEVEMGEYRELTLHCEFRLRRRRRGLGYPEDRQSYPELQAAHVATVGSNLAIDLGVEAGEEVLFGVFKTSNSDVLPRSVVCAFSINMINKLIDDGVKACCNPPVGPGIPRGLDFFQAPSICPNTVSRKEPSPLQPTEWAARLLSYSSNPRGFGRRGQGEKLFLPVS